MSDKYTYYIADARTGQILGDLPFGAVQVDWALSAAGTFSGTLAVSDPDVVAKGGLSLVVPGKNAILVDYNGVLIWAGIIWSEEYDSSQVLSTVTAADFWSYFNRRLVSTDIPQATANIYGTVVPSLFSTHGLNETPPAGLSVSFTTASGAAVEIPVAYTYAATDDKMVSELVEGFASAIPGFDFRQEQRWTSNTTYSVTLVFGRPRIGASVTASGTRFDLPGNITQYKQTIDGSTLCGRDTVIGTSDAGNPPVIVFDNMAASTQTYPAYEGVDSVDESNPDVLARRGQYLFSQRMAPVVSYDVMVRADATPEVGTYLVGDDCLLDITDAKHPGGITANLRIGHLQLKLPDQTVEITPWDGSNG